MFSKVLYHSGPKLTFFGSESRFDSISAKNCMLWSKPGKKNYRDIVRQSLHDLIYKLLANCLEKLIGTCQIYGTENIWKKSIAFVYFTMFFVYNCY